MSTELQTLVALDGEVDRGLIETLVSRNPNAAVLDYLEIGGPTASGVAFMLRRMRTSTWTMTAITLPGRGPKRLLC